MKNNNAIVHLNLSEMQKENRCELCKEIGMTSEHNPSFTYEGYRTYTCHFCGHRESFHEQTGKRKEKPVYSRYM